MPNPFDLSGLLTLFFLIVIVHASGNRFTYA